VISAGDIVRVISDLEKIMKLQAGHGGWRHICDVI